jgi:predicted RNase H-like HicB family nuclease
MSIESDDDPENAGIPTRISLELSDDGEGWLVRDEETGVATEGETRQHALEMLDDAVAAYKGESGREPTDEELREVGIDPEQNTSGSIEDSEIFE